MPKYLYKETEKRRKVEKFNLSQTVVTILETQFFDDNSTDLQHQMEQVNKQIEKVKQQQEILEVRRIDIQKLLNTQKERYDEELTLFNQFKKVVQNRVDTIKEYGLAPKYDLLKVDWHKRFFPDNNIGIKLVKDIIHRCETNHLDFDFFKKIRKGE